MVNTQKYRCDKLKKYIKTFGLLTVLILSSMTTVIAATEEEIEQSIIHGLAWLASDQNIDGSWGTYEETAQTCFALIKLQDRAYELEYESPFDPEYEYSDEIIAGWEYVFSTDALGDPLWAKQTPLSIQTHGVNSDDPDTNGNGYGIYFAGPFDSHPTYTTGICLMALKASGTPGRSNDGGIDYNGDTNSDTFQEIAQDATDWLVFAQSDFGPGEGGWAYGALDNTGNNPGGAHTMEDNSNSGYALLGLAAAEGFGCTVPPWVRTELNIWIGAIQDPVNSDANDGGSWYRPPGSYEWSWVNELKTGNLIFEMTFYGDNPSDLRFQDALDYIERHWQDMNIDPGWGYSLDPAGYQAMYALMKGFEYSGVELLDLDNDNTPEHDWFEEFSTVLVNQQNLDGSWPSCNWGNPTLCTIWALLTLEKVTPPPPVIDVYVDIKPGSCPNPINTGKKGVIPVAILGTEDFDVMTIDPATIQFTMEGIEEGVAPLRWSWEDVATPFEGELYDCHDLNGDGYMDLTLKFKAQEVIETLGLVDYSEMTIPLTLTGTLMEEYGSTPFEGQDCVWVL
jgi:hypothetical protein